MIRRTLVASVLVLLMTAVQGSAAEPGRAVGSFSVDGTTFTLTNAVSTKVEGLFDSNKQDLWVVLSDKPLASTAPEDDIELSLRARKGEIAAIALRIDGAKLVNAQLFYKGLAGKVLLPGAWFDYKSSQPGTGTLQMAAGKEFDGHKYAAKAEYAAIAAAKPKPAPEPAAAPTPAPKPVAAPPAVAKSDPAPKPPSPAILVKALMEKDEAAALQIVKLGVDPNGKDQYGVPMLNWAVMMCQPKVVQALVDKKASLTYQRAPGMTIMAEAGACPEAAKILKAAGAK